MSPAVLPSGDWHSPSALLTQSCDDSLHFWANGLDYETDGKNESELIGHCQPVVAIRKDLGLEMPLQVDRPGVI